MYLNFNVLNNEVFETVCDDKMERRQWMGI